MLAVPTPRTPPVTFRRTPGWFAVALAAFGLVGCGGGNDDDNGGTQAAALAPAVACESLAGKTYFNVQVTTAAAMPASGALPAYCQVKGTEAGTQHDMEVRLPNEWRQRYVQQGGGGFDGRVAPVGKTDLALSAGAVEAVNNGGHRDPSGAVLLDNPLVVERYAHTAILTATKFGKAVTSTYYGRGPSFSYYQGCSNGGRGALNAAAKYGDEFNGVIAGAPTRNLVGQIEQWTRASALVMPTADKLKAINAAAVSKCDALDGATDGIVSKWSACNFDPTVDVPASVGLTVEEAQAVKALMTDLKLSGGTTVYSGFGTGDMSSWGPAYASLGVGHVRNIVLNDPAWSPTAFDVNAFYPTIKAVIDDRYGFNASAAGIAQFMQNGKKVIVWHGSDDSLLSHKDTVRTWQEVQSAAGSNVSEANSRLYIASGVSHCGGGPGADTFDLLTPLMQWVEQGSAPQAIATSKVDPATSTAKFTRPMCVYPAYPKYKGSGDMNSADNFVCSTD